MGTPPPIQIASLGMADSLILMVMALVVFGPRRLPQIGRQIGKLMYEFRKASNDFKFQMEEELRAAEEADRRKKEEERQRTLALVAPAAPAPIQTIEAQAAIGAIESPNPSLYPGESEYPSQYPPETEPKPETSLPRILPPSTGEPVQAVRPTSLVAQVEQQASAPGASETLAEQTTAATEQATHHG